MPSRRAVWILVAVIVLHVPFLLLPPVNHEFAFVDAARYFVNGDRELLDRYFHFQANPLGFPLLARFAMGLTPFLDPLLSARLVSLAGIVLLWAGTRALSTYARRPDTDAILLVLLFNPLVWTFSARATADLLPAGLAVAAVALALTARPRWASTIAAGLLLGTAGVVKYHALAAVGVVWVATVYRRRNREGLGAAAVVTGLAIAMVASYAWVARETYGFWLTPPSFQSLHGWTPTAAPVNVVSYAGYLVLLTAPASLILPGAGARLARRPLSIATAAIGTFALGAAMLRIRGEMGFGPLDRLVPQWIGGGAFLLLSAAIVVPLLGRQDEREVATGTRRALWLAVILTLGALAMSRPAQRYLLLVIPFYLLAIPLDLSRYGRTLAATLLAFTAANGFIGYSQWCTGSAARDIADRIEAAGLSEVTAPGDITSHVANRFPLRTADTGAPPARYVVRAGAVAGAEMTVSRGLAVLPRTYSLVRLQ